MPLSARANGWRVWIMFAFLLVAGCATLSELSAGEVGCKPSEITISDEGGNYPARTWTATCGGRDHACTLIHGDSPQVSCSPMGNEARDWSVVGPTAHGHGGAPRGATAERAYDEERGVHIVRGKFTLTPGFELRLVGIPQIKLGVIAVVLTVNTSIAELPSCPGLEILVNEQPIGSAESSTERKDALVAIESRFSFQQLEPLGQRFATFGVRACGKAFKLNGVQVEELQKLLVIYSQVAIQVQAGELPSQEAPPTAPAPEPAPAATSGDP